ncbi:uncharacterized protein LOC132705141 [Cylas formicarius]|uniref:uncharacterized protein LOC132705141 n=1 Tax=Cylas formicarius TaxID=197179 RepID=UPI002958634D|nr:uncharacterized protein LOC132705141 [Cylas formicarius]
MTPFFLDVDVRPGDLLDSFDIVSLFTNIPVDEALDIIIIPIDTMDLTRHCLKNTYVIYNDKRYKQIEGAPMGSPLSPVIANLFMIALEKRAIETADYKSKLWLRYVDDTFTIWNHGIEQLHRFLQHLNEVHPKIKFTMETEENSQLPFLDVTIIKKETGHLDHTVYRKPTHTNRYQNANSHHHPAQLQSVITTLITRSETLAGGLETEWLLRATITPYRQPQGAVPVRSQPAQTSRHIKQRQTSRAPVQAEFGREV